MPIDTRVHIPDGTGATSQWIGNLLAPLAFLLQLEIAYLLVPRACDSGVLLPVHLAHAGALLIALGGSAIAWREWQRWGREWPADNGGPEGRSRFMSTLAVLLSGGFTLVIVALWLPTFFLHPCQ